MYLPQAASLPPSLGAQSDLFLCMHLALESWFEPTVVAFGPVNRALHAQRHNSASGGPDLFSARTALTCCWD